MYLTISPRLLVPVLVGLLGFRSAQGSAEGWYLREMPVSKRLKNQAATAEEAQRIKALIQNLAGVDAPGLGYSSTIMCGDAFAPLPELDYWGGWTVTAHKLKRAVAIRELVEYGPKALPFLLESLTDRTPTKLTLTPPYANRTGAGRIPVARGVLDWTILLLQVPDGFMNAGREFAYNPLNPRESNALRKARITPRPGLNLGQGIAIEGNPRSDHIKDYKYRLTVGDLCFVATGQITNRAYWAAHYQPTGGVVINSPAHDPMLAKVVRSFWEKRDYQSALYNSLLVDLYSRGGDQRGTAERLQVGAAIRLLYYFPREGGPFVAQRLRELDVTSPDILEKSQGLESNGVRVEDFVKAVNFSDHQAVRKELLAIFRRTAHPKLAVAALPGVPEEHEVEALVKLRLFVKALPRMEDHWEGDGYLLLKAIAPRFSGLDEVVTEYLKTDNVQRRTTVCRVLQDEGAGRTAVKVLAPLLRDKRKAAFSWDFFPSGLPLRICDEAAITIARHKKDLSFKPKDTYEDADRQIQVMLRGLQGKP